MNECQSFIVNNICSDYSIFDINHIVPLVSSKNLYATYVLFPNFFKSQYYFWQLSLPQTPIGRGLPMGGVL